MPCDVVRIGDATAIVCGPRRGKRPPKCWVQHCQAPSTRLCDWPAPAPSDASKTCDRPVCDRHADHVGPDRDYCPPHSIEWAESKLRTGS